MTNENEEKDMNLLAARKIFADPKTKSAAFSKLNAAQSVFL
jgi:hypothetical protein